MLPIETSLISISDFEIVSLGIDKIQIAASNMDKKQNVTGIVLAGGKSSRMGSDKALLLIENETLLGRMIRIISPFCNVVAISGMNENYHSFHTEMIADMYTDIGPIGGIYSALKYSKSDWNLIVSVDVPFITDELLEILSADTDDCDCIIPKHDDGLEPLVGMYHRNTLPVIEKMIHSGDYKLMNLLPKLNVRYIDCNLLIKKQPRLFMNLNRLEDFNSI